MGVEKEGGAYVHGHPTIVVKFGVGHPIMKRGFYVKKKNSIFAFGDTQRVWKTVLILNFWDPPRCPGLRVCGFAPPPQLPRLH